VHMVYIYKELDCSIEELYENYGCDPYL